PRRRHGPQGHLAARRAHPLRRPLGAGEDGRADRLLHRRLCPACTRARERRRTPEGGRVMAAGKAERAVHRLLDMVVEEVSLVDRAANQHRFLIVKRSEPMDQDTAAAADATETPPNDGHHTEPAPPDTDETVVDLNELPDDDGDEVAETKALDGSPSALILATQALEALTEAVEVLGTVSEEEARARVAELARELHMVATRLGGAMNG